MKTPSIKLRSMRRRNVDQTIHKLPYLLDSEFGIIQSMELIQGRHGDPRFVHCHATTADISRVTGRFCNRATGGTALTEDVAKAKAIGESIERYCSDIFNPGKFIFGTFSELKEEAIDPRRFVLFHPDQIKDPSFPFAKLTDQSRIAWVPGFSLTKSRPVLVPASLVHLVYGSEHPEEFFEMGPVSGYACGNSLEEAILGGICEVIERDSFMVFWYNWLPVPGIDLRSFASQEVRQTLDRFHGSPVRIFCSDITTDTGIPTVLAVMTSRQPGWPAAVVATAADLNPEKATAKALQELSANHLYVRSLYESSPGVRPGRPEEVRSQEDHGLFYWHPEQLSALDPVLRPQRMVRASDLINRSSDDLKKNIELCLEQLARLDLEVVVVDITTPDVEDLGFKVVKVLIPGTQPLDFGLDWQHLGGPRLFQAPVNMGYRNEREPVWALNTFPHPFP